MDTSRTAAGVRGQSGRAAEIPVNISKWARICRFLLLCQAVDRRRARRACFMCVLEYKASR